MPDTRTHQSVAQRADVDFHRRPDRLLRRRRIFMLLAGCAAFAPLVYAILSGDETIYWSRPCSGAHRLIQHNCQHCHIERFQGVLMQIEGSKYVRAIETRTCRTCHQDQQAADHSLQMVNAEITSCFECHREHRGEPLLAAVDQRHCTVCHADLRTRDGDPNFFAAIESFDTHPEFAIRRRTGSEALRPGPRHSATGLAKLSEDGGEWTWIDRSRLRFNHALHLQADGIGAPGVDGGPPRRVSLECADCHERDESGQYMRSINYEQHCQSCHPLHFGSELFQFDPKLRLGGPLPHESPRVVRDALRNRLLAYATAHPDRVSGTDAEAPRLPHKERPERPSSRDRWEWVDQRLAEVEGVVYGKSSDMQYPKFMQACTYCHFVEPDTSGAADAAGVPLEWTIAPPEIPDRWLPHSRFRHDRHDNLQFRGRQLECIDCHYRTPPGAPPATGGASTGAAAGEHDTRRPGSIFASDTTRDILLPSIETCRDCHGSADRRVFVGSARNDCVECHTYHHGVPTAE